jgi:hypothetical protein
LPDGGDGREVGAQLRVCGDDLFERATLEPVKSDIGLRSAREGRCVDDPGLASD